jgi:two-component sensor histidine kinase
LPVSGGLLLRLQARRLPSPEGRAALEEAVRRVGSIAIVHDTLSQTFDESVAFDDVADRLLAMVSDVSSAAGLVRARREGSFGVLPGDVATPLAMVLTELLQNAVEHGMGDGAGTVTLRADRSRETLLVDVDDTGVGLPEGFDPATGTLGLSIVTTLVEAELCGELIPGRSPEGGARMSLRFPLERRT